ncbi:alpha/beta hydrolase [Bdellovibrio sp.]|uniref:alpha/beta fold hydrolase n=1 Tax=Bdellovibrio sp. TaxID=28201 RepID=UPI003221E577
MMRNLLCAVMLLFLVGCVTSKPQKAPNVSGNFADVNGLLMYYELYGKAEGVPLVLLHGGGSTIDTTFGRILPFLAQNHRVIAIEEQGHGRTSDRKGPFSFEASADDVAALLKKLNIEQADIFGFSNGASVGMQVALRHPQLVRKLIFASSITKRAGAYPQLWDFMKRADISNMPPPLKEAFLKVNPDPAKLKVMHDKDADRMRNFKDISDQALRTLKVPTLILTGDRDVAKPEHALELNKLIPRSRLAILPAGHGEYLGELVMATKPSKYPELTAGIVDEFLKSSE